MRESCAEFLIKNGIPFAVPLVYNKIGISSRLFFKKEEKIDGIMSHKQVVIMLGGFFNGKQ